MPSCLSPITLRQPTRTVPCGKCPYCLSNKRSDWTFRLALEHRYSNNAIFLTLTIADWKLHWRDGFAQLEKSDLQKFIKRIRQAQKKFSAKQVRYYAVGEYGTKTGRPHYHMLLFNLDERIDIQKYWPKGHIHIGEVNDASIAYCTKYVIQYKDVSQKKLNRPFAIMSKRPAIGHQYLTKQSIAWHKENQFFHCMSNEIKVNMPRYYRKKIFTDRELKLHQMKTIRESFDSLRAKLLKLSKKKIKDPYTYYMKQRLHNSKYIKLKVYHTQTI